MLGREDRPVPANDLLLDMLNGKPPTPARPLKKPGSTVDEGLCAAFSPDGRRVAVGCWLGTVKFWDAQTGQFLSSWGDKEENSWESIAWSADGRRLLLTYGEWLGKQGEVCVRTAADGKALAALAVYAHAQPLRRVQPGRPAGAPFPQPRLRRGGALGRPAGGRRPAGAGHAAGPGRGAGRRGDRQGNGRLARARRRDHLGLLRPRRPAGPHRLARRHGPLLGRQPGRGVFAGAARLR